MNRGTHIAVLMMLVCWMLSGCKPTTPSQYIQPDEMEDILVDYHLAKAVAQEDGRYEDLSYRQSLYYQAVLQKHGVTEELFDSSLVYYYTRADRFAPIYHHVLDRLQDSAAILGASEGEIGRYATLNANGDTANIWTGRKSLILMPTPPYHRVDFAIESDTLFRAGDTFLMQFMSDYLYQSGTKEGMVYLVVEYPDTVMVRESRFTYSGLIQVRMDIRRNECPKAVRGFFHVGGAQEQSTILRLLFVNNIQLIRFHQKNEEPASPENSIQQDSVARRASTEPVSGGDSLRTGRKSLQFDKRTSPNRMVERMDSVKIRR